MITLLRAQYALDWQEWPWQKGAPFYDTNGNGVKDSLEEPGLANADQVLWYVCNDIGVTQPWACPTSGIEQQTTIWAYDRTGQLGNVIFKRFRLFYKGVASTPDTARIDSMYLCQWSDPDVGTFTDDLAGCDTALSLGYCYNGQPIDAMYDSYGLPPPASGYSFLQGPIVFTGNPLDTAIFNFRRVPGARNLPLTAFIFFAAGLSVYTDPPFNYSGAVMWHQMLRGLPPRPQGPPDPGPILDHTCDTTTFMFTGDPVSVTGWLDGGVSGHTSCQSNTIAPPGDRRIVMPSGPFSLAIGDSQEIVVATVVGLGSDYLNSISVLRSNTQAAREFFFDSLAIITNVQAGSNERLNSFALLQNYPNPFNPVTSIPYHVPQTAHVTLRIFDVLGRLVATLVNERKQPGAYAVEWNALDMPSGIYFYRISAGRAVEVRKMVLLK